MKVAVIIGSVSDYDKIENCLAFLKDMGVSYELRALSAHRTTKELFKFISENDDDIDVYIAGAGKAAHLPGVIAANTSKPVIGIPIKSSALEGLDSLLSIVQMPAGVPVATVAINGDKNAAILACQIMALKYPELSKKVKEYKIKMTEDTLAKERKFLEDKQN